MTKSFSDRLLAALEYPDVSKAARRRIYNMTCGPDAEDPPKVKWTILYEEIMQHLKTLRSNKAAVRNDLKPAWQDYYDTISAIPARIREADWSQPIPKDQTQWQGWVPKHVREQHILAFAKVLALNPMRGSKIVPFAPLHYRKANEERLQRCYVGMESARDTYNTTGTKLAPKSHVRVGAVILAACRQAELAMDKYAQRLKDGAHPYEEPALVNYRQYCEPEMRALVRRLLANPADTGFDFTGFEQYFARQPV